MQGPMKTRLSEKQLLKVPLFRSVKQINGERVFRQLCETCFSLTYENRFSDKQLSLKQNFIYIKEGEVLVYKVINGSQTKSLIRSYRSQQYCGFQDYPLFWGEDFMFGVNCKTTLLVVPLGYFYKYFRRVIPMMYLHSKAQFLKRQNLFRGIELQKIFKLACLSQKYRIPKQFTIMKQGDNIDNIIIICSGKLELKSAIISETIICGQNQDFLAKEVKENIELCCFTVKCIQEADVLVIPKQQFKKIIDIRYSLRQMPHKQLEYNREQTIMDDNKSQKSFTSSLYSPNKKIKNFSKSCYPKQRNNSLEPPNNFRLKSASKRTTTYESMKQETEISKQFTPSNYSLGEIQLLKFIRRKQKIENRNFFKYIESRAPQIVINPSKQFALIKPLYKSGSQYVKNMKRRIKNSMSLNQNMNMVTDSIDLTL